MLINLTFKTPDVLDNAREEYILNKIETLSEEFKASYDYNMEYIKEDLGEEFDKLMSQFIKNGEYIDIVIDTESMVCEVA